MCTTFSWKLSAEFSQSEHLKTIQHRAMHLTSLYYLGSWESTYVNFNTTGVENHEGNYFENKRNIKLAQ